MIYKNELRPGNLLQGPPLSIPRLGMFGDGVNAVSAYGIYVYGDTINDKFKAIPLDENWLTKFEFDKVVSENPDIEIQYWKKGFTLYRNHNDTDFIYATYVKSNGELKSGYIIKYIHELQNLYFCLTKEELVYL